MNSFLADDEARIYFLPSFAATRATKPERYNFSIVMILQLNELQFESVVFFFPRSLTFGRAQIILMNAIT